MYNKIWSLFVLLALSVFAMAADDADSCGGDGERPCAYSAATKLKGGCPAGSFFDPIFNGSCWSCPSGFNRTAYKVVDIKRGGSYPKDGAAYPNKLACQQSLLKTTKAKYVKNTSCGAGAFRDPRHSGECWTCAPHRSNSEAPPYKRSVYDVASDKACIGAAYTDHAKAKYKGKPTGVLKTDCPKHSFLDVGKGKCYACPSGFKRSSSSVTSSKACYKHVGESVKKAKFISKEGAQVCTDNEYFDPRKKGQCWSCPAGYIRGVTAVTASDACVAASKNAETQEAKLVKGGPGASSYKDDFGHPYYDLGNKDKWANICGSNGYWDPRNGGECWSCPAGYKRSLAPVNSANACAKPLAVQAKGVLAGKTVGCSKGLIEYNGKCYEKNKCGKEGQRACAVAERTPSCDKGLRESLGTCIKLQPGEIGFLSTLGEWNQEVTDSAKEQCFEKLDMMPAIPTRGIGVDTGKAVKYFNIGFACSAVNELNKVADIANQYNSARKTTEQIVKAAQKAKNRAPCSDTKSEFLGGTCGYLTGTYQIEAGKISCALEGLKAIKITKAQQQNLQETWLRRGELSYEIYQFIKSMAEEDQSNEDSEGDGAGSDGSTVSNAVAELKETTAYQRAQKAWGDSKLKRFVGYKEQLDDVLTAAGYTTQGLSEFFEVDAVRKACGPNL